jgi:HlyD family secretion protein
MAAREPADLALETATVRRGIIVATVSAAGSIEPISQATLTFRTAGRLAQVRVKEGDLIRAGDLLARLDTADAELQIAQAQASLAASEGRLAQLKAAPNAADLAAAEASLAAAQASYERVKAGPTADEIVVVRADLDRAAIALQQAQAAYDKVAWRPDISMLPQSLQLQQATVDYQRAQASFNLKARGPTEAELAAAASQVAQARAQLERLKRGPSPEELAVAQAQVDQMRAALEQAKLRLNDASVIAPFAGTVASLGARVGEPVTAATPMVVLADLSRFLITVSIDETEISRVKVGQEASITLDAFPGEELRGQVTDVAPTAIVQQGVVIYKVKVGLEASQVYLKPGMTANVKIVVGRKENVLLVPNRAIRASGQERQVQVVRAGKPTAVAVQVGLANENETEIVSGLAEGDEVALNVTPTSNPLRGGLFGGGR